MFEEYSTFAYDFINLDNISLEKTLKEVEEIYLNLEQVCLAPQKQGKSGFKCKFAFGRASITNTKSRTFCDLCLQDNQNYVESNQKCLKRSSDQNNEDSHIIIEESVCNKANSIIQLNPTNAIAVEDDNKETESNIQIPRFKQNQRECVINKVILCSVRRVFLNIFKEQNKRLIKSRFCNVQSSQFLYTLCNLVNKCILPTLKSDMISSSEGHTSLKYSFSLSELNEYEKDPTYLAIFLLRFIGINPKDKVKYSDEIEVKVQQIQQCMYKYSLPKLKELIKISEFRILFQYTYFNHFDSILGSEYFLEDKYEEYLSATSKLNKKVMKISNKYEISKYLIS